MQKCFYIVLPIITPNYQLLKVVTSVLVLHLIHKPNDFWDLLSSWLPTGACKALWMFDVWFGWHHIRYHSGLCEWEGFGADFRILVTSEESSRGHLHCQKRGKHLRQDFAVSPHTFPEAIKFLRTLFSLPFAVFTECSLCRVFTPSALHRWSTSTLKERPGTNQGSALFQSRQQRALSTALF